MCCQFPGPHIFFKYKNFDFDQHFLTLVIDYGMFYKLNCGVFHELSIKNVQV